MSERPRVIEVEVAGTPAAPPSRPRPTTRRAPWWLWLAGVAILIPVAVPVAALLVRAVEASDSAWETLFSIRTLELLLRTLAFTAVVTVSATVIGGLGALLLARTDLRFRRAWAVVFSLPLVIPSYVLAMTLLSATGPRGLIADLTGFGTPHLVGFVGAWIALTL